MGTNMRCMIDLTLQGETLVCVGPTKDTAIVGTDDELLMAFLEMMGEPQAWALADSGEIIMLFPHQDMPSEIKEIAERMTAHHLMRKLETASQAAS